MHPLLKPDYKSPLCLSLNTLLHAGVFLNILVVVPTKLFRRKNAQIKSAYTETKLARGS